MAVEGRKTRSSLEGTASAGAIAAASTGLAGEAAPGVPAVEEQAAAMATAVSETGNSAAAGAAAEDVIGSAREAPGVGSGVVGAQVPGDLLAERGSGRALGMDETFDLDVFVRGIVREELRSLLANMDPGSAVRFPRGGAILGTGALHPTADVLDEGYDIEILSRIEGFRRGGVAHPARATLRRSRDFEPEQLAQIMREPNLHVRRL